MSTMMRFANFSRWWVDHTPTHHELLIFHWNTMFSNVKISVGSFQKVPIHHGKSAWFSLSFPFHAFFFIFSGLPHFYWSVHIWSCTTVENNFLTASSLCLCKHVLMRQLIQWERVYVWVGVRILVLEKLVRTQFNSTEL